ncbi:anti-sigma factor RsbA family regulatory protein [Streptomyces adustus]|uniref:anti-sigma factor RsbA family regulatory protein n=1 Tax=Streptomyces adustus TaxID=1609272 RepID=UPI0035DE71E1
MRKAGVRVVQVGRAQRPGESFVHPAFLYRGDDEYRAGIVSFVLEGLAAGEPVAVAVPARRLELIRDALGARAAEVRFTDMTAAGRNPGRIIPTVLRAFADAVAGDRRARIVGEPIWPGRTAEEYPACVQHEALINAAFQGRPVTILCPYDARALSAGTLADAHATHPLVVEAGRTTVSRAYDPQGVLERCNLPLPPPPRTVVVRFDAAALPDTRDTAVHEARSRGMSAARLPDLALVVAELTTNSVVHGGGEGTFRLWAEGGRIVCEVRDSGRLTDPLAGRRPARPEQIGGRGLLLVHRLADLVRTHTGEHGTVTRACLDLR